MRGITATHGAMLLLAAATEVYAQHADFPATPTPTEMLRGGHKQGSRGPNRNAKRSQNPPMPTLVPGQEGEHFSMQEGEHFSMQEGEHSSMQEGEDFSMDPHDRITCPVMGTFVKSGLLVPDADGLVTKQQTFDAFVAAGVPVHIATATTEANFLSEKCPACPEAMNPFEMDTVPSHMSGISPSGGPQEHFRSTGIRDNGASEFDFTTGEQACLQPGATVWTREDAECLTDVWDRDFECEGGQVSYDISEEKRPEGCMPCQGRKQNPACESEMFETMMFMFDAFADPATGTFDRYEYRRMWLNLEFPAWFLGYTPETQNQQGNNQQGNDQQGTISQHNNQHNNKQGNNQQGELPVHEQGELPVHEQGSDDSAQTIFEERFNSAEGAQRWLKPKKARAIELKSGETVLRLKKNGAATIRSRALNVAGAGGRYLHIAFDMATNRKVVAGEGLTVQLNLDGQGWTSLGEPLRSQRPRRMEPSFAGQSLPESVKTAQVRFLGTINEKRAHILLDNVVISLV